MTYDEAWARLAAGPLTELLNLEIAHHELDPKHVHTEGRRILDRVGGDLHPKHARAVLVEVLLQWQLEDSAMPGGELE